MILTPSMQTLPDTSFGIEIAALGTERVLHSRASGVVAVLNETATDAWLALCRNASTRIAARQLARTWGMPASEAETHLSALLQIWDRAGLFDASVPAVAGPDADPTPPIWRWSRTIAAARAVDLRSDCRAFGALIDRVLSPLAVSAPAPRALPPSRRVDVWLTGDERYGIARNGRAVMTGLDLAEVRHLALRELIAAQRPESGIAAVLHAGAVQVGHSAVIAAGTTGAGKSTLMSSLVCAGATYLCDDLVGLDRDGVRVHPFPVKMSLKPGSAAVMLDRIARDPELHVSEPDDYGLRYLDASARAAPPNPVPVGVLCYPRYDASIDGLRVETLTPVEALGELFESGTRLVGDQPTIVPLAKLLSSVPLVRLTYRNQDLAIDHLRERLA